VLGGRLMLGWVLGIAERVGEFAGFVEAIAGLVGVIAGREGR
jgi:hypothetical protein